MASTDSLADRVGRRILAVNLERARLASQALALQKARLRLSTGVDPKIVMTELEVDPSRPLEEGPPYGPADARPGRETSDARVSVDA